MNAESWNEIHVQARAYICEVAGVNEDFAEQEWDDIPRVGRQAIHAVFVKTPFSQVYGG